MQQKEYEKKLNFPLLYIEKLEQQLLDSQHKNKIMEDQILNINNNIQVNINN